ncbi:hypothetical protein ACXPWS_18155 [Mycobacterium sp. BMJ-28]
MTTFAFVSTSAHGLSDSDTPLVSAAALVAGLGTQPTVTFPVVPGRRPDTDAIWRWLAEPAEFFGTAIPGVTQLRRAVADFARELGRRHGPVPAAVTVVVTEIAGSAQFVVTGTPIEPVRTRAVHLRLCAIGPAEPHWRQMAARTTSRAAELLTQREFAAAGHADAVRCDGDRIGPPVLGALVCDTPRGRVGLGADRLSRLAAAGLSDADTITDEPVELATLTRARWVSPNFETHPVRAIGERRL